MKVAQIIARILKTASLRCAPNVSRRPRRSRTAASVHAIDVLEPRVLLTFNIQLDYTYDTSEFFNDPSRREVLEAAAQVFENRITDDLTAITPNGFDNWIATFNHPGTGAELRVSDLSIPADTVLVYVGARELNGELARGGPGGFSSSSTPAFNQNLRSRGEPGIDGNPLTDSDVAPWGGTLTVDSNAVWNLTMAPPSFGQNDLYTVAIHEFAHVLGFGTSASFTNLRSNGRFIGSSATDVFGSSVPLHSDQLHFASNVSSTIPGTQTIQEAVFDPQITTGTRKSLTDLDWAALDDIGWDVSAPPAPRDFADAPDQASGTSTANYQTRLADDGPHHQVSTNLYIGATPPDGDDGLTVGTIRPGGLNTDDASGVDDEGFRGSDVLAVVANAFTSINVNVTNATQSTATLYGWIDYNSNGEFELSERASASVPSGTLDGTVTLNFLNNDDIQPTARITTYARFRLSTDSAAATSTGPAADGEVEDHIVEIYPQNIAYDSLPSFNWQAAPTAERYEVTVDSLTGEVTQIFTDSYVFPSSGSSSTTVSFRPATAFAAGIYQWRYRTFDGTQFGPYSSPVRFQIFEKPGQPVITDPVGASVDSLPTLAWSPIIGATRYELWVDGEARQRVIHQTNLSRTSFTTQYSLPEGSYTAWVRAYSGSTPTGAWSSPFRFNVSAGPVSTIAQVTDPATGTTTSTTPTISWRPTQGTSHRVQIRNVNSDTIVADIDNVTGSHYTLTTALSPGNYSARVSVNGLSSSAPTINFISPTFRVADVSGQAQITSPVGDAENPLTIFTWTSVSGADRYELWVDDLTNRVSRIVHNSNLSTTSLKTPAPLSPGRYRAWVRAFSGRTVIGTWSHPVSFRVTEAPEIPTIWSPQNTVSTADRTIAWSSVTGASGYTLKIHVVNSDQLLDEVLSETEIQNNFFTLPDALSAGQYRITVTTSSGNVSNVNWFVVQPASAPVEVLAPIGLISEARPQFSWSTVADADRYFLWVNDDTRGTAGVILEQNLTDTRFTASESLMPGDYRVWVRAYTGSVAAGPWSEVRRFTIQGETRTALITPANGSSVAASQLVFGWSAAQVGSTYELWVNQLDTNTARIYHERNLSELSFTPSSVAAAGRYRAWVRAIDAGGNPGPWSAGVDFRIVEG